ncbi:MAG TPA: biotin/lipoyl-containing protein, partial [Polyangiaceae bacterium]
MSKFEFKLPDIGEGVAEGEIVNWLVNEGDSVSENQEMVEVMTDKATVTIGAPKSGKVVEIRGSEGDTVPVGSVLVVLDVGAEGGASQAKSAERAAAPSPQQPAKAPEPPPEAAKAKSAGNGASPTDERDLVDESDAPVAAVPEGKSPSVVASAVGDIRDSLPGIPKAPRVVQDDYRNDRPLASPATRKLAREH